MAYEKVTNTHLVTPYSTMGLFLADKICATAWYHNMISGPAGQNKYGSTEGLSIYGDSVSPLVTWDAKMTTVLAIMGGVTDIITDKLTSEKMLDEFLAIIET